MNLDLCDLSIDILDESLFLIIIAGFALFHDSTVALVTTEFCRLIASPLFHSAKCLGCDCARHVDFSFHPV